MDNNGDNSEQEQAAPTTKEGQVTIAMDWDHGQVLLQAQVEGLEKPIQLSIPAEVYVQSAVAIGMQMIQRLDIPKAGKMIHIARPGDVPKLH